ncbi:hypothetical protein L1887_16950 [Cichorium endivia]|nr:hypothetical protein L1887_16950 [Cichorium endivia]
MLHALIRKSEQNLVQFFPLWSFPFLLENPRLRFFAYTIQGFCCFQQSSDDKCPRLDFLEHKHDNPHFCFSNVGLSILHSYNVTVA